MTDQSLSRALLPTGIRDELPTLARQKACAVQAMLELFQGYGYWLVNPPLVEFASAATPRGALQALDASAQKMLAVRTDITPQIARIASTRLHAMPRPLRLCYAGDVLRASGSMLRPERQFTQAGIELLGCDAVSADAEVIGLAVQSLQMLGLKGVTVDICLPPLPEVLLDAQNASAQHRQVFLEALHSRDTGALIGLPDTLRQFGGLLLEQHGEARMVLPRLQTLSWPQTVRPWMQQLAELVTLLEKLALSDVRYSLDLAEQQGFSYHTGVSFSVFAEGVRGEAGRGGRYAVSGSGETATGFSLYLDPLLRALSSAARPSRLLVPFATERATVEKIREEGVVVFYHDDAPLSSQAAQAQECNGFWDSQQQQIIGV
jgi:ATP phosphoribosyltransferase regulatory subunit